MSKETVLLVVYVPIAAADEIRAALLASGAGRVGNYEGCSFSARGLGRFRPLQGANPAMGAVGEIAEIAEERIEVVVDRAIVRAVVGAIRAAHPYEEPVILVTPLLDVLGEDGSSA